MALILMPAVRVLASLICFTKVGIVIAVKTVLPSATIAAAAMAAPPQRSHLFKLFGGELETIGAAGRNAASVEGCTTFNRGSVGLGDRSNAWVGGNSVSAN